MKTRVSPFILMAAFYAAIGMTLTSCTENHMARNYGGEQTIELLKGEKLVEATWKEDNLWYLTEPMDSDYVPTTKIFHESSSFGVWKGKVVFKESR